jgi:hypothetical protein
MTSVGICMPSSISPAHSMCCAQPTACFWSSTASRSSCSLVSSAPSVMNGTSFSSLLVRHLRDGSRRDSLAAGGPLQFPGMRRVVGIPTVASSRGMATPFQDLPPAVPSVRRLSASVAVRSRTPPRSAALSAGFQRHLATPGGGTRRSGRNRSPESSPRLP